MPAHAVIDNFIDTAHCTDLAVSPAAVTAFPVTNLQSNVRDRVWRSSSLATQSITGTFGGNVRTVSFWGLWPSDAVSLIGAQVRLRLWSDVAKTSQVYDSGTVDFFTCTGPNWNAFSSWGAQAWGVDNNDRTARLAPKAVWITPTAASAFQLDISGSPESTYFEARRFWLGEYLVAPYGANYGAAPGWRSSSEQARTLGGSLRRLARARWRELRFEVNFKIEADRSKWADIIYAADPGREIVMSLFPADSTEKLMRDFTVLGSLESLNPVVFQDVNFHTAQFAILES